MTDHNPTTYAAAQARIKAGDWTVDAAAGTVSSRRTGKPIGSVKANGYVGTSFRMDGRQSYVYVHRLVWESVHGPSPVDLQINHIDGNKTNNRIDNLELVTSAENFRHAVDTGLRPLTVDPAVNAAIEDDLRQGLSLRTIAARRGVSKSWVSLIGIAMRRAA